MLINKTLLAIVLRVGVRKAQRFFLARGDT